MEGGLRQPPLPQPHRVFAGQQSVAQSCGQGPIIARLDEPGGALDQHTLDVVRVSEQTDGNVQEPERDNVSILARCPGQKSEEVAPELDDVSEETTALGSGRNLKRAPRLGEGNGHK
jgi:hypothetical protein